MARALPAHPHDEECHPSALAPALARPVAEWTLDDRAALEDAARVLRGEFHFLGRSRTLGSDIDWQSRHVSHLWSYNLHYFAFAVSLARAWRATGDPAFVREFERLAANWVRQTSGGAGDGWEPYPLSVRVVHWIHALLLFGDAVPSTAARQIRASLWMQLRYLEGRLEHHLGANHLQKNLQALVTGSLYFTGRAAARWRRAAPRLWQQVREQVLDDGGHFERSPMYHALALGDLLETVVLCNAAGDPVPADVLHRLRTMVSAYAVLCRPDGRLHLFGDAADGIAPERAHLGRLAELALHSGISEHTGPFDLPATGYFGLVDTTGDRCIVDCGALGPPHQPAHAHCDLLSFELDVAGEQVVVDSGTSGYAEEPLRSYQRGTAAHNTVMIGGREQGEIWGTFRLGRRPTVVHAAQRQTADGVVFEGAYHPYYSRRVLHQRVVTVERGCCAVRDLVTGAAGAPLESFLHLHPALSLERAGERFIARGRSIRVEIVPFGIDEVHVCAGSTSPTQGWYACAFGAARPAPTLVMRVSENRGEPFGYRISWQAE